MDIDALIDQAVTDAQVVWGERVGQRENARPLAAQQGRSVYHNTWTAEEDAFYLAHAGRMSLAEIGAHLGRSTNAIKIHYIRVGMPAPSKQPGYLTAQRVAEILGIDGHKTVAWMRQGIMPGEICPGTFYHRTSLVRFKMWLVKPENWIYFDARKIKNLALRSLVQRAQLRWGDEWWNTCRVGEYLGVDYKSIHHKIKLGKIYGIQAKNKGGRDLARWAFWFMRKSDVVRLAIAKYKGGNNRNYYWPAGADAFLIRARAQGLIWEVIGRMMKWDKKRCAYRYHILKLAGKVAG